MQSLHVRREFSGGGGPLDSISCHRGYDRLRREEAVVAVSPSGSACQLAPLPGCDLSR